MSYEYLLEKFASPSVIRSLRRRWDRLADDDHMTAILTFGGLPATGGAIGYMSYQNRKGLERAEDGTAYEEAHGSSMPVRASYNREGAPMGPTRPPNMTMNSRYPESRY